MDPGGVAMDRNGVAEDHEAMELSGVAEALDLSSQGSNGCGLGSDWLRHAADYEAMENEAATLVCHGSGQCRPGSELCYHGSQAIVLTNVAEVMDQRSHDSV